MITIFLAVSLAITSFLAINNKEITAEEMMLEKQDSILSIRHQEGAGTVFVVRANSGKKVGITNNHVCDAFKDFLLVSRDGDRQYKSTLIANYKTHDLCMVTVPQDLPALDLAEKVFIDEKVFSAGFSGMPAMSSTSGYFRGVFTFTDIMPVPLNKCFGRVVPKGTKIGPTVTTEPVCLFSGGVQYTTMGVTFGASGSPVLNSSGEVVGVVMALQGTLSWCLSVPLKQLKIFLSKY